MSFKCIICEESLAFLFPGEAVRNIVSTSCGHVFHSICIRKWIQLKTRQYYRFAEPTDRFALHCPYTCPSISKSSFNPLLLEDANDNDSTFRIRHIPVLLNQGSPKPPSPAPALTLTRPSSSTFTVATYHQRESDEDENSVFEEEEEEHPGDSTPSPSPTNRERDDHNESSDRNGELSNQLVGVSINNLNQSEKLGSNNESDSASASLSSMLASFLQLVEAQEDPDLDENANNVEPKASPAVVSKPTLDLPFPNEFTVVLERNVETWKVGDFVIWAYGDVNIGRLRWIGKFRNQPYAGVEFAAPIGNYMRRNAEFPDIKCKTGFGRLVRVSDLQLVIPGDDRY